MVRYGTGRRVELFTATSSALGVRVVGPCHDVPASGDNHIVSTIIIRRRNPLETPHLRFKGLLGLGLI